MNQMQEQFYQVMTRLRANSRAASAPSNDTRITEMINGVMISKPAKKYTDLSKQEQHTDDSEPVVIELGNSKAGSSVSGYGSNPVKELFDFILSNGRLQV